MTGIHSSITVDPSGCTIAELYRASNTGRSISFYNPDTRMVSDIRVLGGPPIRMAGATRWTWERLDANTVTQKADQTSDNGKTWINMFSGTYTRR